MPPGKFVSEQKKGVEVLTSPTTVEDTSRQHDHKPHKLFHRLPSFSFLLCANIALSSQDQCDTSLGFFLFQICQFPQQRK